MVNMQLIAVSASVVMLAVIADSARRPAAAVASLLQRPRRHCLRAALPASPSLPWPLCATIIIIFSIFAIRLEMIVLIGFICGVLIFDK